MDFAVDGSDIYVFFIMVIVVLKILILDGCGWSSRILHMIYIGIEKIRSRKRALLNVARFFMFFSQKVLHKNRVRGRYLR